MAGGDGCRARALQLRGTHRTPRWVACHLPRRCPSRRHCTQGGCMWPPVGSTAWKRRGRLAAEPGSLRGGSSSAGRKGAAGRTRPPQPSSSPWDLPARDRTSTDAGRRKNAPGGLGEAERGGGPGRGRCGQGVQAAEAGGVLGPGRGQVGQARQHGGEGGGGGDLQGASGRASWGPGPARLEGLPASTLTSWRRTRLPCTGV